MALRRRLVIALLVAGGVGGYGIEIARWHHHGCGYAGNGWAERGWADHGRWDRDDRPPPPPRGPGAAPEAPPPDR